MSLTELLQYVRSAAIRGEIAYLREYVFSQFETEDEMHIDETTDSILAVLTPYLQREEAAGDDKREVRLSRLLQVLDVSESRIKDAFVFAMYFDEIQSLLERHDAGVISADTLHQQVEKLSPTNFSVQDVIAWGRSHRHESIPRPDYIEAAT